MDIDKLKARKAQIERERDDFLRQAQAQIERMSGAIAILDELIAGEETVQPEPDKT